MANDTGAKVQRMFRQWVAKHNFNYFGLVAGTLSLVLSLTPSLMPRSWLLQGIVGGVSFAVGYGVGVVVSWIVRSLFEYDFSKKTKEKAWNIFPFVAGPILIIFFALHLGWQQQVRDLGGFEDPPGYHVIFLILASVLFSYAFVGLGRWIRKQYNKLKKTLIKRLPPKAGLALTIVITLLFTVWFFNGFLHGVVLNTSEAVFSIWNNSDPDGYDVPPWPEHSGSSESLLHWDTHGYQGKRFVAESSTIEEMTEFNSAPAMQPIRIYAGVESADTDEARAQLVIEEIRRTKAMERDVILLISPTGSGWIDPNALLAIEHMYGGSVASVTVQYSYLASWMITILDPMRAGDTSKELFDQVYEEWTKQPENNRPKLVTYGMSLGSYGAQAPFSGTADLASRTAGGLFQGSPNFSEPWRYMTDNRDEGSKEVRPVYDEGKIAVFASDKEDILENDGNTELPRFLFQQHASDGVVWWSPDLLFHEPDWLKEEPGKGVIDSMRWIPFVTFLQVAVDQAVAGGAPEGSGHSYGNTLAYAWASVIPPDGWTIEDSDRLQSKLDQIKTKGATSL